MEKTMEKISRLIKKMELPESYDEHKALSFVADIIDDTYMAEWVGTVGVDKKVLAVIENLMGNLAVCR